MKKSLSLIILLSVFAIANAQLIKTNASQNGFDGVLKKIVAEFPYNFTGIQGDALPSDGTSTMYVSTVCPPAGKNCTITKYRSDEDKSASWQCTIFSGEEFKDAVKAYKSLSSQLKSVYFTGIEKLPISLNGKTEEANESLRFTASSFRLKTDQLPYKFLIADAELTSNFTGWEVRLNIYTNKMTPSDLNE